MRRGVGSELLETITLVRLEGVEEETGECKVNIIKTNNNYRY